MDATINLLKLKRDRRNGLSLERFDVLTIFGTRPEFIKLAPVVLDLKRRKSILFVSANGTASRIAGSILIFGITPDINLRVMKKGSTQVP